MKEHLKHLANLILDEKYDDFRKYLATLDPDQVGKLVVTLTRAFNINQLLEIVRANDPP